MVHYGPVEFQLELVLGFAKLKPQAPCKIGNKGQYGKDDCRKTKLSKIHGSPIPLRLVQIPLGISTM